MAPRQISRPSSSSRTQMTGAAIPAAGDADPEPAAPERLRRVSGLLATRHFPKALSQLLWRGIVPEPERMPYSSDSEARVE